MKTYRKTNPLDLMRLDRVLVKSKRDEDIDTDKEFYVAGRTEDVVQLASLTDDMYEVPALVGFRTSLFEFFRLYDGAVDFSEIGPSADYVFVHEPEECPIEITLGDGTVLQREGATWDLTGKREHPTLKNSDIVNHPPHYTQHPSGIECIEITRHMGFNIGNAVKYLWRADLKHDDGGIEDLRKAAWYITDELRKRGADA